MSNSIQPFRIEIPQADVDYLHDRLATARWPGRAARRGVEPRRAARRPEGARRVLASSIRLAVS